MVRGRDKRGRDKRTSIHNKDYCCPVKSRTEFERLFALTLSSAFFVVRTKSNVLLQWRYSHPVDKSVSGRSRRRCASRATRWRRPASNAPPCYGIPNDKACLARNPGRLRCHADSRDRSTKRTPLPDTDSSK